MGICVFRHMSHVAVRSVASLPFANDSTRLPACPHYIRYEIPATTQQ